MHNTSLLMPITQNNRYLLQLLAVELTATATETSCSLLGSDITLRLSHQLITDQELANSRAPQKRRVEVQVQIRGLHLLLSTVQRSLVNTHGVREVRFKEVIVAASDLGDSLSQEGLIGTGEIDQSALVSAGDDHGLERPSCPPGADDNESLVLKHNAFLLQALELRVVLQHVATAMLLAVPAELLQLCRGLFWQCAGGPDLAMRVGVGAAHGGTLVLKNLHIPVLLLGLGDAGVGCRGLDVGWARILSQRGLGRQMRSIDLGPSVDYGYDLGR